MNTHQNKLVMSTLIKSFAIISMSIAISSCIDKHIGEPLGVKNNSDARIYYWFAYWKTENYTKYHYPYTILPEKKPVYLNSVASHNTAGYGEDDPDWEKIYSELSDGKFSIYFFNNQINTQEEWNVVRQSYNLYRKDVSYQELVKNNYCINYP